MYDLGYLTFIIHFKFNVLHANDELGALILKWALCKIVHINSAGVKSGLY